MKRSSSEARDKLLEVFENALSHDGFAQIIVDMRILKRRQKEVIVHFGKQYRFVVDFDIHQPESTDGGGDPAP